MSYEPDKYHQTNPPCELKRDVMGRKGSKKNKHQSGEQVGSTALLAPHRFDGATIDEIEFIMKFPSRRCWGVFFKSTGDGEWHLLINCTDKDHALAVAKPEHKVMMFEAVPIPAADVERWEQLESKFPRANV